jgi:hypothetical protein
VEENGQSCAEEPDIDERNDPPGDFTSEKLREDTARFLDELRRRAEVKRRRQPPKKPGAPPKN